MAKALVGHLPPVQQQTHQLAQLRRRVADLEDLVSRLSGENDALAAANLALRAADRAGPDAVSVLPAPLPRLASRPARDRVAV